MVWVALKRVIWISIGNAIGLLFSIVLILEYRTIRGIIACCISSLIVLSASIL
jgi:PST family polysaccharide transporter